MSKSSFYAAISYSDESKAGGYEMWANQ